MKEALFTFSTPDVAYFAALQNTAGAGALVLNGTGAILNSVYPQPITTTGNFARAVSLTSLNDNSALNFVINGTDSLNNVLSQTIAGPNANTVQTTTFFNTVTSITANGAVNGVSAGTGSTGASDWWIPNEFITPFQIGIRFTVVATVNYTLQTTDFPINSHTPPGVVPAARIDPSPDTNVVSATSSAYTELGTPNAGFNSGPVHALRGLVNSSSGGTQSLIMSVSQAGQLA